MNDRTSSEKKNKIINDRRWYNTNDIVKQEGNDLIRFVGRSDDVVKIHGYRVQLSEIESIITNFPSVESCAVVCEKEHLVAFVSPVETNVNDLKAFIGKNLATYSIPKIFTLPSLPLTPSNKIDRKCLGKLYSH